MSLLNSLLYQGSRQPSGGYSLADSYSGMMMGDTSITDPTQGYNYQPTQQPSQGFSLAGALGGIGDGMVKYKDTIGGLTGLGQLGLGLANYGREKKLANTQIAGMRQQLAFNQAAMDNKKNIQDKFQRSLAGGV